MCSRDAQRRKRLPASLRALACSAILLVSASGCGSGGSGGTARSFSDGGRLVSDPDGRLVVTGDGSVFAVARFTVDGHPDRSFGRDGTMITHFGSKHGGTALEVVIGADRKILALGESQPPHGCQVCDSYTGCSGCDRAALARYLPDGRLDPSFGRGGKVLGNARTAIAEAGALQEDGKIVAPVWSRTANRQAYYDELARYGVDGQLDPSFGARGFEKGITLDDVRDIAVQSDGKILLAGATEPGGVPTFSLARHLLDGRLDPSFGAGGTVTISGDVADAVAIQHDGKIVAVGSSNGENALARFMPDGRLDPSFGTGGETVSRGWPLFVDEALAVAIQPDGKIVAGGSRSHSSGKSPAFFLLTRYTADGHLDPSFARDGRIIDQHLGPVDGLVVERNGKIVTSATLHAGWDELPNPDFVLTRYNADGTRDRSFGNSAAVVIDLPGR